MCARMKKHALAQTHSFTSLIPNTIIKLYIEIDENMRCNLLTTAYLIICASNVIRVRAVDINDAPSALPSDEPSQTPSLTLTSTSVPTITRKTQEPSGVLTNAHVPSQTPTIGVDSVSDTNSPSLESTEDQEGNDGRPSNTPSVRGMSSATPMPSSHKTMAPSDAMKVKPQKPTYYTPRPNYFRPTTPSVPDGYISESESDSYVAHAIGWMALFAVVGMIFTAYQLDTNPDGICASFCRLMVSLSACLLKVLCLPCRFICGCPSGGDDRISSPDYRSDYYSRRGNVGSFQMT